LVRSSTKFNEKSRSIFAPQPSKKPLESGCIEIDVSPVSGTQKCPPSQKRCPENPVGKPLHAQSIA